MITSGNKKAARCSNTKRHLIINNNTMNEKKTNVNTLVDTFNNNFKPSNFPTLSHQNAENLIVNLDEYLREIEAHNERKAEIDWLLKNYESLLSIWQRGFLSDIRCKRKISKYKQFWLEAISNQCRFDKYCPPNPTCYGLFV